MTTRVSDRIGIFIVRLWIEAEAQDGFRARITHTLDSTGAEHATAAAGDPQEVYDLVRNWVEAFVDQDPGRRRLDRSGGLAG